MKTVMIGEADAVPALGQGTWNMGDDPTRKTEEIATLRRGIELGMTLLDTAELYGSGRSETLVGEAVADIRDDVFLVSKLLPSNASFQGTIKACEQSLNRLQTDRIDLYLLHWPGNHPLEETIAAFEQLQQSGKINHWGVSNFDANDMAQLATVKGGNAVACNQVLYNLTRRGIEWDLLPQAKTFGPPIMAYSPIEQARLLRDMDLQKLALEAGMTTAQLTLAWVLRHENLIAIPKASSLTHVEENAKAAKFQLPQDMLTTLDSLFPAPNGPVSLEVI